MIAAVLVGLAIAGLLVVGGVLLQAVDFRARQEGYLDGVADARLDAAMRRPARALDKRLN